MERLALPSVTPEPLSRRKCCRPSRQSVGEEVSAVAHHSETTKVRSSDFKNNFKKVQEIFSLRQDVKKSIPADKK